MATFALSEILFATRGSFLTLYYALCAFSQMETLVRAARCLKQICIAFYWEQKHSNILESGTSIIMVKTIVSYDYMLPFHTAAFIGCALYQISILNCTFVLSEH